MVVPFAPPTLTGIPLLVHICTTFTNSLTPMGAYIMCPLFYELCDCLTGIRLWAQICAHLNFELRDCLITFPIFVFSQRLIARNVHELFSFNRGVLHLNKACRIDDASRGSLSCYEILTNN
jgi:hypothetical protein